MAEVTAPPTYARNLPDLSRIVEMPQDALKLSTGENAQAGPRPVGESNLRMEPWWPALRACLGGAPWSRRREKPDCPTGWRTVRFVLCHAGGRI